MKTWHHDTSPSLIPMHVAQMFEDLAFTVWEAGHDHYSARAILHQIRWHHQVVRGNREFKCNNNWTPALSRWFMQKYPEMNGFFELRQTKRPLDAQEGRVATLPDPHRDPPL
jgi:hypothetical protein